MLKGIGVAGIAGFAGCTDGGNGGGDDGDGRELKLGILMGVTGQLANLGPSIRDAALLAAAQVNDADTGFSVDSQFEDTATDPNQGISGGEALVNSGYPMICGALSSTVSIQVANNVSVPNEVVQCSPASTSPAISDLDDNDFMWRTPPTDALQGQVIAQVGMERHDASTAATLFLNNDYGQLLAESFENAFEDQDGSITDSVSFEPSQSSYTSRINTAMSGDPDVLVIVGYPESGVQIFRDYYADYSNDDATIIVPDGLKDDGLPGDVGNDMSNVEGTAPLAAGPGVDFFTQEYENTYDGSPGVFTGQSYDAAAVLLLANAAAGENHGPSIRDSIDQVTAQAGERIEPEQLPKGIELAADGRRVNYGGASGSIRFDGNGDISGLSYEYFSFAGADGITRLQTLDGGQA